MADLTHKLKAKFPNATITHNGGFRWIGGILNIDDLCLISNDAHKFQLMINTCQTWSEKARMQLIADKTTIMRFQFTRVLWICFLQFQLVFQEPFICALKYLQMTL